MNFSMYIHLREVFHLICMPCPALPCPFFLSRTPADHRHELLHPRHRHSHWPREYVHVSTPSLLHSTALCCVLWWPSYWWLQIHYYSVSFKTRYISSPLPVAVRIPAMWYRPTETLSLSFLLLHQGCNSIMAWNPWSKTDNFPRSDRVRCHRVQQLRQHDISIKNGKLNFILILTTHTYCTLCGRLSQFLFDHPASPIWRILGGWTTYQCHASLNA